MNHHRTTVISFNICHYYYYHYYRHFIYSCFIYILLIQTVTTHNYIPRPSSLSTSVVAALHTISIPTIVKRGCSGSSGGDRHTSITKPPHYRWKSSLSSSFSTANSIHLDKTRMMMTNNKNNDNDNNNENIDDPTSIPPRPIPVTIGFIGCGTIASAIVTGLAKYQRQQQQSANTTNDIDDNKSNSYRSSTGSNRLHIERIIITKRSESKSTLLQSLFPQFVYVSETNQNVVDMADIIFITVLPNQTQVVLQELQFSSQRHILISLVSTCSIDSLCTYSQLPMQQVYKMICLPGVQYNNDGICLLQIPPNTNIRDDNNNDNDNDAVKEVIETSSITEIPAITIPEKISYSILMDLLGILGHVVTTTSDEQMSTYMVPSGLMGLFYGILRTNRNWILLNHNNHNNNNNHNLPPTEPTTSTTATTTTDTTTATTTTISKQQKHKQQKIATELILRYYNNMIQDAIRRLDESNDDTDTDTDVLEELIHEQTPGGLNEQALVNGNAILDLYPYIQDAMLLRILGKSNGALVGPVEPVPVSISSNTTIPSSSSHEEK